MSEKTVKIKLNSGLHARSAALFVQEASRFQSDIFIEKSGRKINAKSIMGLLSLAIAQDEFITIYTDGQDEAEALQTLSAFVQNETN